MNDLSTAGHIHPSNASHVEDELDKPTASLSYWSFGSYADPEGTIVLRVVVQCIVIPVIAFIGIVANALNMAVLSKLKKVKRAPIYDILLSMTAADLSVTGCAFVNSALFSLRSSPAIEDDDIRSLSDVEQKFFLAMDPIISFFTFISNWNTTLVAAFRFVAVYFPLRAARWCTPRLTRATVAGTIVAAFLLAPLPRAIILLLEVSELDRKAYLIFHATINDLLPWTSSVVLVGLLLASLRGRSTNALATEQSRDRHRGEYRQLTATLAFTAAWFIFTTAPSTVCTMALLSDKVVSGESAVQLERLYHVGQALALTNFSGNFFFYSWINKSHRKVLRELVSSCTRRLTLRFNILVGQRQDSTAPLRCTSSTTF